MEGKETARLEAFSDGVFAIAITLLVLELRVPDGDLLRGLLHEWPSFLSFSLSFVTILIMWTNHHANLSHVVRADGRLLFANGFLLMLVTFLPFPTAVLAEHLADGDANVAATFYAGTFVLINLVWAGFWRSIVRGRAHLAPTLPDHEVRTVNVALGVGFLSYLAATGLALLSAAAGVGLCMLLAGFWTFQAMRHHRDDHGHHDPGSSA
ncbi:MAG: TMEM175 family protein [Thermoplasmatota archaeon]